MLQDTVRALLDGIPVAHGADTTPTVTDQQIQELTATAQPYSLVILRWTPQRHRDGAEAIGLEHQRRMVSLHAAGTIAVLCPVLSETICGIAIMTVPADKADALMTADPCVMAAIMTFETHACHGFPGDTLPA